MSSDNMTPSTIAMQEDAMWAEYRAELAASAPPAGAEQPEISSGSIAIKERTEDTASVVCDPPDGLGRFTVTDSGPVHLYPSGKKGQTTKDRRYLPQTKFSDQGKALGKTPGRKDKSYRQLKHEGTSAGSM